MARELRQYAGMGKELVHFSHSALRHLDMLQCKAAPRGDSRQRVLCALRRTLKELRLRSDQTDLVFGCSHISQPVLQHLACCPQLRRLTITSAELMAVDLSSLSYLTALEARHSARASLGCLRHHTHHPHRS